MTRISKWITKSHLSKLAFSMTVMFGTQAGAIAGADNYSQGVSFFNARRYSEARAYFSAELKANPNNTNAYYYAGLCYQREENFLTARNIFNFLSTNRPETQAGKLAIAALADLNSNPRAATAFKNAPQSVIASAATSAITASNSQNNSVHSYAAAANSDRSSRRAATSASDLESLPAHEDVFFTGSGSQIWIAAEINRRPVSLLFDTGAGDVVLGKNQLSELGINLAMNTKADALTSGSSNASTVEVWRVPAEVKVGRITRKLPISILEDNQASPLLGQSFFQDFQYKIDYPAHRISFTRKGLPQSDNGQSASSGVPFKWDPEEPSKMLVTVNINGRNCPVWFDTGNSADGISFDKAAFQKLGMRIPPDAVKAQTMGVTGVGQCWQFRVPYVRFGPIDKTDALISVHEEEGMGKPLLGQSMYNAYEYNVDNERKMIYFKHRGHGTD